MDQVASNSVGLVVTSPPYFAGKQYEESMGIDGVPATYLEYLGLLRDVFAECKRVLEPGGRIAVNVANLGRRPYRSLSGDVTELLQELGLLLRGEIIWWKGRVPGDRAHGVPSSAPAIRFSANDRTDRDRRQGTFRSRPCHPPNGSTGTSLRRRPFHVMNSWRQPPTCGRSRRRVPPRVGHPAPFPVELPSRLIELYTYQGDLVLDPFMGSGSAAVAALRTRRHFIGFDTDEEYVAAARLRIAEESGRAVAQPSATSRPFRVELPAVAAEPPEDDVVTRAVREGRTAKDLAAGLLAECGFINIRSDPKLRGPGYDPQL